MTAYLLLKTYMEYHVSWSYRGKSRSLIETKQTNFSMYSPYSEATVKSRKKLFSKLPLLRAFNLLQ